MSVAICSAMQVPFIDVSLDLGALLEDNLFATSVYIQSSSCQFL